MTRIRRFALLPALVRTLADVFHDQAWMIQHYATYVLHLERALADIEETLSLMNPLLASNKKVKSKDKELVKEQKILAKIIMVRLSLRSSSGQ